MKQIPLVLLALTLGLASVSYGRATKSSIGETLPELNLEYIGAAPEFAGKPVVVEFWATWCPPCRTSIPHLNELYTKYKEQGLVIIGVSDEKKSVVAKFLKTTPMEYFPAIDNGGKLSDSFGVSGIPHALLVDKSGKIVWEGHPTRLTDKQISEVLK